MGKVDVAGTKHGNAAQSATIRFFSHSRTCAGQLFWRSCRRQRLVFGPH